MMRKMAKTTQEICAEYEQYQADEYEACEEEMAELDCDWNRPNHED